MEDFHKLIQSTHFCPETAVFGVKGGAEAAVHAARSYLNHLDSDSAMVKLDFRNAFNTVRRDRMLETTSVFAPDLYPFVHSSYAESSSLFWEGRVIQSAEGVQQGDPLGPLLFCLSIHRPTSSLVSEFCVCYLDDITLGEPCWLYLHKSGAKTLVVSTLSRLTVRIDWVKIGKTLWLNSKNSCHKNLD